MDGLQWRLRRGVKTMLSPIGGTAPATGASVLIYHRVGGGTRDERDLTEAAFRAQIEVLRQHEVVSLDQALARQAAGDDGPTVVLTFDDGFSDVADPVLPLLAAAGLPFTLYLTTAYVGGVMHWDGSTATASGPALDWHQLRKLVDSGLCTIGNHTHTHCRPELLSAEELDRCSEEIEKQLGVTPQHFAYTWGIAVPAMEAQLASRFVSAATGEIGRNNPGDDLLRLRRIPVRQSDPLRFFVSKITGRLWPEQVYAGLVAGAKKVGLPA